MSEFSTRWMRIESSGVRNSLSPFTGDWNFTPSSVILRNAPRLNTWNPPESVRIGPSQPMKRCKPPCAAITSRPGRSHRWKVLPSTICAPMSRSSAGDIAFTVPYVPTGMKAGVCTAPCASVNWPHRAAPEVAFKSNCMLVPLDKHGIAITEKPVFFFHRMAVRRQHLLHPAEGAHQHQQRGSGQMEIGQQHIHRPKAVTGRDEDLCLSAPSLQFALFGR